MDVVRGRVKPGIGVEVAFEDLSPAGTSLLLDTDHRDLAMSTRRLGALRCVGRLFAPAVSIVVVRDAQQLTAAGEIVFTLRTMVAAVASRSGVALGQNVHRPATYELRASQANFHTRVASGLVFATCPERHDSILVRDQTQVRNRTARDITRQVLQHVCRFALAVGRAFHEHVPIRGRELRQPRLPLRRFLQRRPLAFQLQLVATHQPPESVHIVLTKLSPQLFVVHQEGLAAAALRRMPAGDPTLPVEGWTTTILTALEETAPACPIIRLVRFLQKKLHLSVSRKEFELN